jgi:L-lactate utilization protein LutB
MNDYLFEGKNIINNAGRIFPDVELVRKRAANIKYRTLEQLDKYLIEFEENVEKNNGKILWAYSKKDILRTVRNLLIEFNSHNVLIGGGSILDEIEIRSHLFKKKEKLLQKKEKHDVVTGIYGANFLIADAGTAVIAELMDNIIPQHKYPKNIIIIGNRTTTSIIKRSGCIYSFSINI